MIPIKKTKIIVLPIFKIAVMPSSVLNTNTSFINVTNLSLTLSEPGLYRLLMYVRSTVNLPAKFVVFRFFNQTTSTVVTESETGTGLDNIGTFTSSQNSTSIEVFLTINSTTIITVQAKGSTATGTGVVSDVNGRSVMTAIGYRF